MKRPRRIVQRSSTLPRLTPERERELRTALDGLAYGNQKTIAAKLGMSPTSLRYWKKMFGMPLFTAADRSAYLATHGQNRPVMIRGTKRVPKVTGVPMGDVRLHGDERDEVMKARLRTLEENEIVQRQDLLRRGWGGDVDALLTLYAKYNKCRLIQVEGRLSLQERTRLPWLHQEAAHTATPSRLGNSTSPRRECAEPASAG